MYKKSQNENKQFYINHGKLCTFFWGSVDKSPGSMVWVFLCRGPKPWLVEVIEQKKTQNNLSSH